MEEIAIDWLVLIKEYSPKLILFVFQGLGYGFLGLLLSVLLIMVLKIFKVFKRDNKYYNLIVKLYYPYIILVCVIGMSKIGFFKGVQANLDDEIPVVVSYIYDETLGEYFENEEDKREFFIKVGEVISITNGVIDESNKSVEKIFKTVIDSVIKNESGFALVDSAKNRLADYFMREYGDEIVSAFLFASVNMGLAYMGGGHADATVSYSSIKMMVNTLSLMKNIEIKGNITQSISISLQTKMDAYFYKLYRSIYFSLVLLLSIPIIEFLIYKKWGKQINIRRLY